MQQTPMMLALAAAGLYGAGVASGAWLFGAEDPLPLPKVAQAEVKPRGAQHDPFTSSWPSAQPSDPARTNRERRRDTAAKLEGGALDNRTLDALSMTLLGPGTIPETGEPRGWEDDAPPLRQQEAAAQKSKAKKSTKLAMKDLDKQTRKAVKKYCKANNLKLSDPECQSAAQDPTVAAAYLEQQGGAMDAEREARRAARAQRRAQRGD